MTGIFSNSNGQNIQGIYCKGYYIKKNQDYYHNHNHGEFFCWYLGHKMLFTCRNKSSNLKDHQLIHYSNLYYNDSVFTINRKVCIINNQNYIII